MLPPDPAKAQLPRIRAVTETETLCLTDVMIHFGMSCAEEADAMLTDLAERMTHHAGTGFQIQWVRDPADMNSNPLREWGHFVKRYIHPEDPDAAT